MAAPDPRFFLTRPGLGVAEACEIAGAALRVGTGEVDHASRLTGAQPGAAAFAETTKAQGDGTPTLILTAPALEGGVREAFPLAAIATAERPKAAFAALAAHLHLSRVEASAPPGGIAETARIAATAQVAPSAVVAEDALIHDDAVIGPFALIGPGVVIGPGTMISSHASVTHAVIGAGCRFSAGVRVGEAGFGYAPGEAGAVQMPQLGRVLIGDRVDLGANTTVDRGALEDTVIGEGTKIDNLCQVAHGCRIGASVLIASQTGISGSCVIGDGVMIGGQAGMADHLTVGEGAVVTAGAGLMKDVPPGERWGGRPAKPARQWMKETAALSRLASKRDG